MSGTGTMLPWLAAPLARAMDTAFGHALLVHGPRGIGQFELALALAQGWLCESTGPRPCGHCASCKLVQARTHPDLLVLLPEALREELGWDAAADEPAGDKAGKAKPSKDIRVDAVRAAVAFAQTTSARGRGKLVLIHPADRMNAVAANALLKTLEEPPGDARLILSTARADVLLPTLRSRCRALALPLPTPAQAAGWLAGQGLSQPEVLLAAAGGQPLLAAETAAAGLDAALWLRLPGLVQRGEAGPLVALPLPRLVDALQKLCHDALSVAVGAAPRFFPASSLAGGGDIVALGAWARSLTSAARHAEHPWSAGLMAESLVQQGQRAMLRAPHPGGPAPQGRASIHSAP